MRHETLTRLRNAFALAATDWLDQPDATARTAESALPFSSMTEADWRAAVRLWREHAGELLATLAPRPCPACGSDRSRWLFQTYDAHPQHECERCGCWFVPLVVDSAVFDRLFERSPEAAALAGRMMSGRDRADGRDADMARVGGYLDDLLPLVAVPAGATIHYLDAGCGVGHSLRAGLARGLSVQGVEVDRTAIALARADGLPVAALGEAIPAGPYQLLSFWETLEHIADPLQALHAYLPLLAPGGLVAITVPNLNALATRILRESCPWVHGGYNTPGHVNLFHPPSLKRLLARAGLVLLDADGQFSGNPLELAAYLAGATRGAFDTLDPSLERRTLPESVETFLTAVWPGPAIVERIALASPILQVVACRAGEEARFAPVVAARRDRRRQQAVDQACALIAEEPDYRAISEGLQQEVARRDELLDTTQRTANDLQRQLAEAQRQINLRDDLLAQARAAFDGTVDARARRAARLARRLVLRKD
jgi:SAM-dependent methyltransferase